jgi:hypothetical protein
MEPLFYGLLAGIAATGAMTITEIPSWKRWGLQGVFEWHENQRITSYLVGTVNANFYAIFSLHFLNGILAAMVFPSIISFLVPFANLLLLSILYGIVLWVLTLAPIHKPITGLHPWNHPLGHMPAILSLVGHVVYGIILGVTFTLTGWPIK